MEIKFIDNNKEHGIKYDFNLIRKELNKLHCPPTVYNPFKSHVIKSGKWYLDLSERSTGKSTNWILLGLCMNKLYGTQIIYVREMTDMIRPAHSRQLFNTILEWDYISKLTDGAYNSVKYQSRSWFYYNTEKDIMADEAFMVVLSIEENILNKSSFNAPRGDLIIFDEFISKHNYANQFVDLCDTLKTIIRERDSAIIVLLANTIDRHTFWFKELGIYEQIQKMEIDTSKEYTNKGGTVISIALMGKKANQMPEHRKEHNRKFFGFLNPKLNAITGGDWAMRIYPHPPKALEDDIPKKIAYNRYIRHNNYLLQLELFKSNELGLYCICHKANQTYDDSIIYTLEDITAKNERYKWGDRNIDKLLYKLLKGNKWYYATNLEGSLIDNYINELSKLR